MVELAAGTHSRLQGPLHGLTESRRSFRNDPVLSAQYNDFRSAYWKWRAALIDGMTFEGGGGI